MEISAINIRKTEEYTSKKNKIEMVDFYDEATEDYQFWSNDYNMHFGYFLPFKTNVFRRDSMLNQMNHQVLKRLQLNKQKALLADLGCGMGGTMRYALKKQLKLEGFCKVEVEDISFRVAPSVLHVPFAIFGFILKKLLGSENLKKESLHNLKGSFYALLSGLHLKSFGYYLITCTK